MWLLAGLGGWLLASGVVALGWARWMRATRGNG